MKRTLLLVILCLLFSPALARTAIDNAAARGNASQFTSASKTSNGVRLADQWCKTPGTLDRSCIQNAIDDITAHGQIVTINALAFRQGVVNIPAGDYTIASPLVIPKGTQVLVIGAGVESNWGTRLHSGNNDLLTITSDAVTIQGIFFDGAAGIAAGHSCVTLGDATHSVFDSYIDNNWFQGCGKAVHAVKFSGGHFNGNNMEMGTYGVYSNVSTGDLAASSMIIGGLRCYSTNVACVWVTGDGSANFADNSIDGGLFDYSSNQAANPNAGMIFFDRVRNFKISAVTFHGCKAADCPQGENTADDIRVTSSTNGIISGTTHWAPGRNAIFLNADSGVVVGAASVHGCNVGNSRGTTAAVIADSLTNSIITGVATSHDVTNLNNCTYGIADGSSSVGTSIYGNNLEAGVTGTYFVQNTAVSSLTYGTLYAQAAANPKVYVTDGNGIGATDKTVALSYNTLYDYAELQAYMNGTGAKALYLNRLGGKVSVGAGGLATTGNVVQPTANGATWTRGSISEEITLSKGGSTTDSTADMLPANSIIEAVVARVTTTITKATDWELGDGTVAGRFAAPNSTLTAGTTEVGLAHVDLTGTSGPRQTAATKLRVTCTGTPGAGKIRVTVFYRSFVSPQS